MKYLSLLLFTFSLNSWAILPILKNDFSYKTSIVNETEVLFIYEGHTSQKNKFLVCGYPIELKYALKKDVPSLACRETGLVVDRENLDLFLRDMGFFESSQNSNLYCRVEIFGKNREVFSLNGTMHRPFNLFYCDKALSYSSFSMTDGSISYQSLSGDFKLNNSGETSGEVLYSKEPELQLLSWKKEGKGKYLEEIKLPCFPGKSIKSKFRVINGERYEEYDSGIADFKSKESKKHIESFLINLVTHLGPLWKKLSAKQLDLNLRKMGVKDEFLLSKEELTFLSENIRMSSSSSDALVNTYTLGATLVLKGLIAGQEISVSDGENLCSELNQSCSDFIGESIDLFRMCLIKNKNQRKSISECISRLEENATGEIASKLPGVFLEGYIGDDQASYLCEDKVKDKCINGCHPDNCLSQARLLLNEIARDEVRSCLKKFGINDGTPFEVKMETCVKSGVINAVKFISVKGGGKKIESVLSKMGKRYPGLRSKIEDQINESFKSCMGPGENNFSKPITPPLELYSESREEINYDKLSKVSVDDLKDSLLNCIDEVSFSGTQVAIEKFIIEKSSASLKEYVEDEEERRLLSLDLANSVLGKEYLECAKEETELAKKTRGDKTAHSASPENCIGLLTFAGGHKGVSLIYDQYISKLKTPPSVIESVLDEDGLLSEMIWRDEFEECRKVNGEKVPRASEFDEKEIEKLYLDCAFKGLNGLTQIMTIDKINSNPLMQQYDIHLGDRFQRKVAKKVASCMEKVVKPDNVKSLDDFGELIEVGERRCSDKAYRMILNPEVVRGVVTKELQKQLGDKYSKFSDEIAEDMVRYYSCFYEAKDDGCYALAMKYSLELNFPEKPYSGEQLVKFLESELTKVGNIIGAHVILKKEIENKLGDYFFSVPKKLTDDAFEIIKQEGIVSDVIDGLNEKKGLEELSTSAERKAVKVLTPFVFNEKLRPYSQLGEKYKKVQMKKLGSCMDKITGDPMKSSGDSCSPINSCITETGKVVLTKIVRADIQSEIDTYMKSIGENEEEDGYIERSLRSSAASLTESFINPTEIKDIAENCVKEEKLFSCSNFLEFVEKSKDEITEEVTACLCKSIPMRLKPILCTSVKEE